MGNMDLHIYTHDKTMYKCIRVINISLCLKVYWTILEKDNWLLSLVPRPVVFDNRGIRFNYLCLESLTQSLKMLLQYFW